MSSLRSSSTLRSSLGRVAACLWFGLAVLSAVPLPAAAQVQEAPAGDTQPQPSKAATETVLAASADTSEVGSEVTFTAAVKGAGGTPTGTVTFKDGETVLGSADLSDGRASLATSALPAGQRAITATYAGDAAFEGSVSAARAHSVAKTATSVTLSVSSTTSEAGTEVTFTAAVSGAGGVPTGAVTFKDGDSVLGRAELSQGGARWTTSDLATGQHTITAAYGGDATFGESVSEPQTHLVQQSQLAVLTLLLAIVLAAVMVLFRRIVFRWLLRPAARGLRALFRSLRRLLRLGGRASVRQRPGKSAVSLGMGALAEGFTETEDAIADGFDPASVPIERKSRFVCSWIRPQYERPQLDAERDFESAEQLFDAEVPLGSNPLNLYDDIHNAFTVRLFESDKPCFHVLTEFKNAISGNVLAKIANHTLIVAVVLALNIALPTTWIDFIDFHGRLSFDRILDPTYIIPLLGVEIKTPTEVNKLMFALVTCFAGFVQMWLFNSLSYEQSQRYNGQQLRTFLVDYLSSISKDFEAILARATQAVIRETGVEAVTRESLVLITNLNWMSIRMLFIKQFLRNILFQLHRNWTFAVFLVPFLFGFLLYAAFELLAYLQLFVLGLNLNNYWFYPLFVWLLYEYGRHLTNALAPVMESIQEDEYDRYHLGLVAAMTQIMGAYAAQLEQFRTRFRPGQGPGSQ